jgi:hypothetical protein
LPLRVRAVAEALLSLPAEARRRVAELLASG